MTSTKAKKTTMKPGRPERTYRTGVVIRALRILALLAVVAIAGYALALYPSLPQMVPTHFDLQGQADDVGHRSSVLWLNLVMIGLAVPLAWLSVKPRAFNYPVEITEHNAQAIYREGERMMVALLAALAALQLGLTLAVTGGNGAVLIACAVAAMVIVSLAAIVRIAIVAAR